MARLDPTVENHARQAIMDFLARRRLRTGARKVWLVSYPRSGSTLLRQYFSILQGCAQLSVYPDDVVSAKSFAITHALGDVPLVKSHQMPKDDGAMIYLVRDGRNATLSFLYMTFLFGGHRFSELSEVYDGIRRLDETEGRWADHVAQAHEQSKTRRMLFVRYEDLVADPAASLVQMARFMDGNISSEVANECVRRQRATDDYAQNPYNGYTYQPTKGSIYDLLKRNRRGDYWRDIFDDQSKRYFHQSGGTRWLLQFGYEQAADWWAREAR